ncbi:MAG: ADP-ribosylglycohydrolase family protein [Synergistaceae bacterium]
MLGSIVGDIIGSRFEGMNNYPRIKNFSLFPKSTRFTDDTIMTVATCDAILFGRNYGDVYKEYYARYPHAGYGKSFKAWAQSENKDPYNSWGNGSAMRVSPIGWAFKTETEVLEEAKNSASVTHNHPEGIKGAQSVALAIHMLRNGANKRDVDERISKDFEYDLHPAIKNEWDVSCQGCVPQAFASFLDSVGFEDCIRRAIFRGGDSDTIAAIAGSIAEPYYGIPKDIMESTFYKLSEDISNITELFIQKYIDECFEKPRIEDYNWKRLFRILIR